MASFASSATSCGARKHAWTNNMAHPPLARCECGKLQLIDKSDPTLHIIAQ